MKLLKALTILSFVCACAFAQAQQEPVYASVNKYLPEYQGLKLTPVSSNLSETKALYGPFVVEDAPGQKMIRVGKTLTIGGSILLVGGVILLATADEVFYTSTTTNGTTTEEGDPKGALGLVMATGGVGMIIPGIIVWSKGKKKYAAYQAGNASLSLGVNRDGAGLRYSF